jgi:predicted NBD/HSP70 family sugar kinase
MSPQAYPQSEGGPVFQLGTRGRHVAAIAQILIADQNRALAMGGEMHTSAGEIGRLLGIEPGGQRGVSGLLRKLAEKGLVLRKSNQSKKTPAALSWQSFGSFLGIAISPEQKTVYAALVDICGNVHQVADGSGSGSELGSAFIYEEPWEPAFSRLFANFEDRLGRTADPSGIEFGRVRAEFRQAIKRECYRAIKWAMSTLGEFDWDTVPVADFSLDPFTGFKRAGKRAAGDGAVDARSRLAGIGIAMEGLVDSGSGMMRRSLNYDVGDDFQLRDELVEYLRINGLIFNRTVPVVIENDVKSLARLAQFESLAAEGLLFGIAEIGEKDNVVVLKLRDGLGGAILSDRDLLLGQNRTAGEVGHLAVEYNDGRSRAPLELGARRCRCGRDGCGESVVQDRRLLDDFNARYGVYNMGPVKPAPQIDRSMGGDIPAWLVSMQQEGGSEQVKSAAAGTLERAGRALGRTVAHIHCLLDPAQTIVFSSHLCHSEVFCAAVTTHAEGKRYPMLNDPSIRYVDLQDRYIAQGAACAAIQAYLWSRAAPWANWLFAS